METVLKPTSQKNLVQDIFRGKSLTRRVCKSCDNMVFGDIDYFYNLALEVKNLKGLEDSLTKQMEGEIISDFRCEACNELVDI